MTNTYQLDNEKFGVLYKRDQADSDTFDLEDGSLDPILKFEVVEFSDFQKLY